MRILAGILLAVSLSAAPQVQLQRADKQVHVTIGGKPFSTYYFDPKIAKPYLMPLRTASGVVVTRSFPVENSAAMGDPKGSSFEPHQRPLYFGHGDIDGLDFWQEQVFDHYYTDHGHQAYGHVVLKKVDEISGDHIRATFTLRDPNDRVIGEEMQTYTFSGDDDTRIVDCDIVMTATNGPLDFGDTKEGTFALRLATELLSRHAAATAG